MSQKAHKQHLDSDLNGTEPYVDKVSLSFECSKLKYWLYITICPINRKHLPH